MRRRPRIDKRAALITAEQGANRAARLADPAAYYRDVLANRAKADAARREAAETSKP